MISGSGPGTAQGPQELPDSAPVHEPSSRARKQKRGSLGLAASALRPEGRAPRPGSWINVAWPPHVVVAFLSLRSRGRSTTTTTKSNPRADRSDSFGLLSPQFFVSGVYLRTFGRLQFGQTGGGLHGSASRRGGPGIARRTRDRLLELEVTGTRTGDSRKHHYLAKGLH